MFKLTKNTNGLRQGKLITNHGEIKTPFFMPDATRGFIKLLSPSELKKTETKALVVNTFHLYLQPGIKIIKKAGGIHRFMNWDGPLLADSGGFQVFSLIYKNKNLGKITDEKVIFRSPIDGSLHDLSPEKSLQIQFDLGVDMMVCLDDCPPNDVPYNQLEKAVNRTIAWAKRSKAEYCRQLKKRKITDHKRPLLFAVIQGGPDQNLRTRCAQELIALGFDGYGFGARPVDEKGNFLEDVLRLTAELIPKNALRFALGVGAPDDIKRCAYLGWDMFDCVIPTREGRHGKLFFEKGSKYTTININNAKFISDFSAINKNSKISDLVFHNRAFLHHLFRLKEPLGQKLASLNNLEFYQNILKRLLLKK